jgi:hypothetical protein
VELEAAAGEEEQIAKGIGRAAFAFEAPALEVDGKVAVVADVDNFCSRIAGAANGCHADAGIYGRGDGGSGGHSAAGVAAGVAAGNGKSFADEN